MRIGMHGVHGVVIAGNQMLDPRAFRDPRYCSPLAPATACGNIAQNPHDIGFTYNSIPTTRQLGIVFARVHKPPFLSHQAMPDM
jgi:hypothetical protein